MAEREQGLIVKSEREIERQRARGTEERRIREGGMSTKGESEDRLDGKGGRNV